MGSSQDFKSLQETIQKALVSTTRLANQIAAEDLTFQRTSNPDVAEDLDDVSSRLLGLTSSLLQSATKGTDIAAPSLEDADDVDVYWSRIVDVLDHLLEKADTCLDEYTGAIKRKAAPPDQPAVPAKKSRYALDQSFRRANMLKPQHAFEIKPNNHEASPWKPSLTKKPHATLPLDKSLVTFIDEAQSTQYKHPYETEILSLEYPKALLQRKEPIPYLPIESTTATYVDTFDGVLEMLEELKSAKEIAIDTEHHDFRTYSGLLSLMQISTREKDWIVDTLQPWRHKLEVLNEVFADPKIVKVLHGAYMDIIWLQRDCGLYIVGLFDTYEAACALQYPGRSLAYLLKRFVDFDADKKYQLADWRIRPLPEEMLYYARSDTHYLLYIYDNLRNELLSSSQPNTPGGDLMRQVLDKSKETSLRRHETSVYDAETGQGSFGWFNMLVRQSTGKFSKEQFSAFRAIHQWRDELARKEDESPLFIMNNATVFNIARCLPPDPKALHSLLDSGSFLAKREVSNLSEIIADAITRGAEGPSVAEVLRGNASAAMGIGEVARTVFPQLKERAKDTLDMKDIMSHSSQLWGDIPMSTRWDSQRQTSLPKQIKFELPWAQYVQSAKPVDVMNPGGSGDIAMSDNATAEHLEPVTSGNANGNLVPEDSEFTLKTGLKRKAADQESSSESDDESEIGSETNERTGSESNAAPRPSDEEIPMSEEGDTDGMKKRAENERNERRIARRAELKERKIAMRAELKALRLRHKEAKRQKKERMDREKVKKLAQKNANAGSTVEDGEADENDEPFDYSKAKSVLKKDKDNTTANHTDAGRKAKFNPYALTAEGPKPARKMHGEKTGKSGIFKP